MGDVINFGYKPPFKGYNTPEPSLRDLIYKYYATHFTAEEAEAFTEQYISFYNAKHA